MLYICPASLVIYHKCIGYIAYTISSLLYILYQPVSVSPLSLYRTLLNIMPPKTVSKPRLRASCDGCFLAKVKCSKLRPVCSRCLTVGLHCRYSPSSRAGKGSTNSGISQKQAGRGRRYLADGGEDLASTLWTESCVELGAYLQSRMYRGPRSGPYIQTPYHHSLGPLDVRSNAFHEEHPGRHTGNETANHPWPEGAGGEVSSWQSDFNAVHSPDVLLSPPWVESPAVHKEHYTFPPFSHPSPPPSSNGLGVWTQAEILEQELWSQHGPWYALSPDTGGMTGPGSNSSR